MPASYENAEEISSLFETSTFKPTRGDVLMLFETLMNIHLLKPLGFTWISIYYRYGVVFKSP
jgi:hypothetical protein